MNARFKLVSRTLLRYLEKPLLFISANLKCFWTDIFGMKIVFHYMAIFSRALSNMHSHSRSTQSHQHFYLAICHWLSLSLSLSLCIWRLTRAILTVTKNQNQFLFKPMTCSIPTKLNSFFLLFFSLSLSFFLHSLTWISFYEKNSNSMK